MRVVFTVHFGYRSVFIFFAACTLHDVGIFETYFLARSHSEIFFRSIFHEVFAFYPQFTAEFDGMASGFRIFGIVDGFQLFHFAFGIVGDYQFYRIQYGGNTGCTNIQIFANGTLQQRELIKRIVGGISYFINELTDGLRGVSATAESADGRHTGVVPAVHQAFFHQSKQVAFTHQGITEV